MPGNEYWVQGTKTGQIVGQTGMATYSSQKYNANPSWVGGSTGGSFSADCYYQNSDGESTRPAGIWYTETLNPATCVQGYGTSTAAGPPLGVNYINPVTQTNTLTDLVNQWLAEQNGQLDGGHGVTNQNAGLCLFSTDYSSSYADNLTFAGVNYTTDVTLRPKLTINYTPVPEPSTSALLAAGLIGMLAYAGRRRKYEDWA